jgi:outer membrane protein TolC
MPAIMALIVSLALLGLVPQRAVAQVSLKTVVDLAQRNSTAVRGALADVDKANANLSQAKDVLIPAIDIQTGLPVFPEVGYTGSPPSIWSATVQSLVYSVPQKRYIDAGHLGVKAAQTRLKDTEEEVALEASTAYIELDTVNQQLIAARQQEEHAGRLVEVELQRTEAGVDAMSELLNARLTAAEIKLKRIHLQSRAKSLEKQLSILTGLPDGSIQVDHASIPEIPQIRADGHPVKTAGIIASRLIADSKSAQAKGDSESRYIPTLHFYVQYLRNTTILNEVNSYFAKPLPANNFASGISVDIPLLNFNRYASARESAADALRSKVEAERAERQNDLAISDLSGSIAELDAQAEVANLKQQIAADQLKTVLAQLDLGNGSGSGPGSQPQASPKMEQLARIDASQKVQDSMDAGFDLAKARLNLLRALGHMSDWLDELKGK